MINIKVVLCNQTSIKYKPYFIAL